ncbi:MAG: 4Fe-4S binding protein [Chloroflexota bacterium]
MWRARFASDSSLRSARLVYRCLAADVCKVRAIVSIDLDELPYLDIERCYDCRLCIPACPFGAVQVLHPA